jgi:integrase
MSRQVFKRCTRCAKRPRLAAGDRRCPTCGGSDHTWGFVVDIGADPATGKRRRRRGGGYPTRKAAEAALRELLDKRDLDQLVPTTTMTVRTFLVDQWLPAMQLSIGPTTLVGYRGNVERYIVPRVGDLQLRALTPPRINLLYADVRANGRQRGNAPLSLKTVRDVHATLHRALEDAVRWDYLATNPSDRATAPSATAARNERRRSIRTWSAAEVAAFDRFIAGHELHELWALTASTGMRRSEVVGLRWIDVDLDRRLVAIRRVLIGRRTSHLQGRTQVRPRLPNHQHPTPRYRAAPCVTAASRQRSLAAYRPTRAGARVLPARRRPVVPRPCERHDTEAHQGERPAPHPAHAGPPPYSRHAADR